MLCLPGSGAKLCGGKAQPAATAKSGEGRISIDLSRGWRFRQGDAVGDVPGGSFDDSQWSQVELPHTWNRLGNVGTERSALTNTVQGVGWYRLGSDVPITRGEALLSEFDGVGAIADVWLNGHYLGKHAGAFSRFRFDASAAIEPSGENLLVVKADNSRPQPGSTTENVIPLSAISSYSGHIPRRDPDRHRSCACGYARLRRTGAVRQSPDPRRELRDRTGVRQTGQRRLRSRRRLMVETRIEDSAVVAASESSIYRRRRAARRDREYACRVQHPRLWRGTKDPYLYKLVMTILLAPGVLRIELAQPLGLRSHRFRFPRVGFSLNGEHLLPEGCVHASGPSRSKDGRFRTPDQAQDFDLLQDMGGNAVRLAHYQHDQYSYELADALGDGGLGGDSPGEQGVL